MSAAILQAPILQIPSISMRSPALRTSLKDNQQKRKSCTSTETQNSHSNASHKCAHTTAFQENTHIRMAAHCIQSSNHTMPELSLDDAEMTNEITKQDSKENLHVPVGEENTCSGVVVNDDIDCAHHAIIPSQGTMQESMTENYASITLMKENVSSRTKETHEGTTVVQGQKVQQIATCTIPMDDAKATVPLTVELSCESEPPTAISHTLSSSDVVPCAGGPALLYSFLPSPTTTTSTSTCTTSTTTSTPQSNDDMPHKGLVNLGNTCYLNSALQMLMSVDDFVAQIIDIYENDSTTDTCTSIDTPSETRMCDAADIGHSETQASDDFPQIERQMEETDRYPLRDALAQFFLSARQTRNDNSDDECNQLYSSTVVDPTNLKRVIDEKTSLFAGFWQQDSHEFLSTILDLLRDEIVEGEAAVSEGQSRETHPIERADNGDRIETSDDKELLEDYTSTGTYTDIGTDTSLGEVLEEDFVMIEKVDTQESIETEESHYANKKPRVDSCASITKVRSFSELNLKGINTLLHGEEETLRRKKEIVLDKPWAALETSTSDLQCKLIGGRIAVIVSEPKIQLRAQSAELENDLLDRLGEVESSYNTNSDDENEDESESATDDDPAVVKPLWTDNVVDNFFTMAVRTHLTCDSCKYTRSHEEIFRHLSIEIGPADEENNLESCEERSIQEGLRKFFEEGNRELKCEECFCESATQSSEITKLPKSLIVHLKRFIVDVSADYTSVSYRKNRAAIQFGEKISLHQDDNDGILGVVLANDVTYPSKNNHQISNHSDDDAMSCSDDDFDAMSIASEQSYIGVSQKDRHYHIRSVVNHIGESAQCGHYTADAHKIYSKESETGNEHHYRKWTRFNDSDVTQIDESDSMGRGSQETAYMIMYELVE